MISVIIPIYNAEAYLKRTFDCILQQTFADYEVILVDDGSTDRSGKLCDAMTQTDGRFRCIHKKNGGVSEARNLGLQHIRGEFVTFLDADDIVPPDYLQVLSATLEKNHAQIAVCDVSILSGGREIRRFACGCPLLSRQQALNRILSRKEINSGPCAKLFRREILENLSFPPLKVYEDILFVMQAVERCDLLAATSAVAYVYEQNESSAMHRLQKVPSEDVIYATQQILAYLRQHRELKPDCFYITVSHLMQYVQELQQNPSAEAKRFIRHTRRLFRRYFWGILGCRSFPYKEKILFAAFSLGVDLHR